MGKIFDLIGKGVKFFAHELSVEAQAKREIKRNDLNCEVLTSKDQFTLAELRHKLIESPHFQELFILSLLQGIFGEHLDVLLPGGHNQHVLGQGGQGQRRAQIQNHIELLSSLGQILENQISHFHAMVEAGQIDEPTALDLIQDARARIDRLFRQAMGDEE